MRLGIMQPYFFPYLGYFSLIKHVDKFILLDEVQYIRHGWIERNRILKPVKGWQYFRLSLESHSRDTLIKDIKIDNQQDWKRKIPSQLKHYKKRAPFFLQVMDLIANCFSTEYIDIVSLNYACLNAVCNYLEITTPIKVFSEMGLDIEPVHEPDDWALNITKAVDAKEYWNPPGGIDLFDKNKYEVNGITLRFHKCKLSEYDQGRAQFEPDLSILDVMMFNKPSVVREMIENYELL